MNFDGFELPEQDPCFICEVVRNGKPDDFVEETDGTIARVNSRQFLKGQCLIAPKRHAPTVFDLTESEMIQVLVVDFRNRYNVVWNRMCAYNKVVSPTALGGNRCLDRSRSINPSLRRRRSQRLVGLHDNERHPAPMFTGPRWS